MWDTVFESSLHSQVLTHLELETFLWGSSEDAVALPKMKYVPVFIPTFMEEM